MLKSLNKRIRNYGFWTSLLALIPLVIQALGFDVVPSEYSDLVSAFLAFLVAAGIISNPTVGKGYLDENKDGIDDSLQ